MAKKHSTTGSPLEISEILHNVLAHLSNNDLVRVMPVNRKWYAETSRLLWKTITFTDHGSIEQGEKTMRKLKEFTRVCKDWKEDKGSRKKNGGGGCGERRDSLGSVGEMGKQEQEQERKREEEEEEEEEQENNDEREIEQRRTKESRPWHGRRSNRDSTRESRQKSGRHFFATPAARLRQLFASGLSSIMSGDNNPTRRHTDFFKRSSSPPTQNYASLIRTLSVRKVKDPVLNTLLKSVANNARYLNTLELYICDFIQDATVLAFIDAGLETPISATLPLESPSSCNTFLTNISVPGCSCITDAAVMYIAKRCPALEVLDLRACSAITDTSLVEIAARCPRLRHINVGRIKDRCNVTIKSIAPLAKGTNLRVLGLAGCDITDECMSVLAEHRGAEIERISVNHCPDITNVSLRAFLGACPRLTVFEMKACTSLNDWSAIAELARKNVLLSLSDNQQAELEEWSARNGLVIFLKKPYRGKMA